jgi:hypothetical protein
LGTLLDQQQWSWASQLERRRWGPLRLLKNEKKVSIKVKGK